MNHQYLVVIEAARENYAAYSPDVPGCVATGRTKDEALELMRQAIALHLHGLRDDGLLVPEPRSTAEYVSV
jgi:predicted RNase H-like HicB family nuclease